MNTALFWSVALKSFNILLAGGVVVIVVEPHFLVAVFKYWDSDLSASISVHIFK